MRDRRFRLLVNPFQYKLVKRVFLYWLIYQLSLWNFLFFWRLIAEGRGNPWEQYVRFFRDFYPMLFCFALVVPFFALDALRLSHRVVGPMNRFRSAMRQITAAQPVRRVRLRNGDELDDMLHDFNAMLEALQRRGALTLLDAVPVDSAAQDSTIRLREDAEGGSHGPTHPAQTA